MNRLLDGFVAGQVFKEPYLLLPGDKCCHYLHIPVDMDGFYGRIVYLVQR